MASDLVSLAYLDIDAWLSYSPMSTMSPVSLYLTRLSTGLIYISISGKVNFIARVVVVQTTHFFFLLSYVMLIIYTFVVLGCSSFT